MFIWYLVVSADIILIITDPPELIPSKDPSAQCRLHQETEFGSESRVLWSKNGEVQAHAVEYMLSLTGCGRGCFIGFCFFIFGLASRNAGS